ncbi:unnamed protein product [Rotaria sordida]|uniref:Uncharacterized protein n=1 Tax=Rotaria sordida TaxID=392033 RepID=A0A815C2R9_9BILA|nr:unnamed protein product [Rotaria sordida]CAF1557537.1 unnamed protein product [Rotaria sordida]
MSVSLVDQDKASDMNDDHERWLHYSELVRKGHLDKQYIEDGTEMQLKVNEMEDADWPIVLEEVNNKEHPLRKLRLEWDSGIYGNKKPIKPGFIKLTEALGFCKTLVEFTYYSRDSSMDENLIVSLKSLKDNRSIKYLSIMSVHFDLETTRVFSQMLTNNQTLLSLNMSVYAHSQFEKGESWTSPLNSECVVELARSLQTTALEWLKIEEIDDNGFEVLARSLPKTLVHLNLTGNKITGENIPTIRSYLQSNGENLKELILDDNLATQYFQQQESSSLSTVKIVSDRSLNSQVLQSFTADKCEIGDIGFQAILSSLPNSLFQLEFTSKQISEKSLPALLAFVETHPTLKQIKIEFGINKNSSTPVNASDLVAKILKITNKNHCICQIEFS